MREPYAERPAPLGCQAVCSIVCVYIFSQAFLTGSIVFTRHATCDSTHSVETKYIPGMHITYEDFVNYGSSN